jgi:hypothetical protein
VQTCPTVAITRSSRTVFSTQLVTSHASLRLSQLFPSFVSFRLSLRSFVRNQINFTDIPLNNNRFKVISSSCSVIHDFKFLFVSVFILLFRSFSFVLCPSSFKSYFRSLSTVPPVFTPPSHSSVLQVAASDWRLARSKYQNFEA